MSAAPFKWSPASTPSPPEYWGRSSATPNSGEKYATTVTGSPYGTTMPRKKPAMRHHQRKRASPEGERTMSVYPGMADDRWYQRAVFYEVLVRGYYDASA